MSITDIDGLQLSDIQLSVFQKCASTRPSQQAEQRKPPKVHLLYVNWIQELCLLSEWM